jgi:hypothetical protein
MKLEIPQVKNLPMSDDYWQGSLQMRCYDCPEEDGWNGDYKHEFA